MFHWNTYRYLKIMQFCIFLLNQTLCLSPPNIHTEANTAPIKAEHYITIESRKEKLPKGSRTSDNSISYGSIKIQ